MKVDVGMERPEADNQERGSDPGPFQEAAPLLSVPGRPCRTALGSYGWFVDFAVGEAPPPPPRRSEVGKIT